MSAAHAPLPATTRSKVPSAFGRHKLFVLFLFLLATLILEPYVENSYYGYLALRIFGSAGVLYAVYAINLRRTVLLCGILLSIPAVLQRLLQFQPDKGTLSLLNIVLSFTFDVFVVVVIFRRVAMEHEPTSETIFGALCIYLLVGFSFASIYGMLNSLQPGSFYLNPLLNHHSSPDRFDFVYYSFATMTTVGANGIDAVSRQARSITVIEATLGVLYLAVLIARLVSAYRMRAPEMSD
jgi:ion channel